MLGRTTSMAGMDVQGRWQKNVDLETMLQRCLNHPAALGLRRMALAYASPGRILSHAPPYKLQGYFRRDKGPIHLFCAPQLSNLTAPLARTATFRRLQHQLPL